ncbi:MAG: AAA family ATPase [Bacteroidales bacterium]|jgi:shikimate kinase|nr:AAA family ATPase [Bacteroidales bacterium]
MHIYIIGFMGCGKTTVGKKLAAKINYPFIDLDKYIEEKHNKSILSLLNTDNDIEFRKLEKEALHTVSEAYKNVVISTGGGTPCFSDNINYMNSIGETFYLEADIPLINDRLKNAKTLRPLIANKTQEEIFNYTEILLKERKPYYRQAKHKIDAISIKINQIVELLGLGNQHRL